MTKVIVVDYDIGNVFSVCRALELAGAEPELTGDPNAIKNAERLILPGVGAFASAQSELYKRNIVEPVFDFINSGRPFMGICVGMQMLMESSKEFGETSGLGLFSGCVDKIPETGADGVAHCVPHISWACLDQAENGQAWESSVLSDLEPGRSACYFVHSFMAYPENQSDVLAVADYNGRAITAALRKDNITGLQFHPEKSGPAGQKVLKRFMKL